MKYLKLYESFSEIESICRDYGIKNYTINADGSIDVDADVNLNHESLKELPLKFGKVTGDFNCGGNELTSLEGCPKYVGGGFYCNDNQLTSLEGAPKYVGGDFYCHVNQLTSLEGCPKYVGDDIYLYMNPVNAIWKLFEDKEYIELFNDYDVIRGDSVIIDRLNEFLQEIGKDPVKSVQGYKNI